VTPDDETLMAYADGELDAVTARRIERQVAADPLLAARVEAHRRLRAQLAEAFPLGNQPDPLEAMIRAAPVPLAPRPLPVWRRGLVQAVAMAACLVLGIFLDNLWDSAPVTTDHNGALLAAGGLAQALDTQLAGIQGKTNIRITFRDAHGNYCRVFSGAAVDGIACRDGAQWRLVRTGTSAAPARSDYRQAGSEEAAIMAEAQDMMATEVTPAQEKQARDGGWRPDR
jgi:hypothetical protein